MLYVWLNENGIICTTFDLEFVPQEFKDKVKVFEELSINDADKLYVDAKGKIRLKSEEDLAKEKREGLKRDLLLQARGVINQRLMEEGYHSFGDLLFYKELGEKEAVSLLEWYKAFDRAVWDFIERVLPKMGLSELQELNPRQIIEELLANLGKT